MVPVIAVGMTVGDFVCRCATHILDLAFEKQALPCKRVIAVDDHFAARDVGDRVHDPSIVFVTLRQSFELHANFNTGGKDTLGLDTYQILIVIAERIRRLQRGRKLFTRGLACQSLLDQWKDAAVTTVQVRELRTGFAERIAVAVEQVI